ncbi:MAG TPA: hypothetical protein VGA62_08340 [Acidimicrobiia bacterium]
MARALECPACGEKHRIDNLPDTPTFRCERCGQVLKVPSQTTTPSSAPPTRTTSPVAPPPRRSGGGATAPARAAGGGAVGVSATVAAAEEGDAPSSRPQRRARAETASASPAKVPWYWRLVAWIVAVPLGFAITAWPAYQFNFIRKDDVLNVFVGSGIGRYARLAIETALWALVTALLVQLFVDGGRRLVRRRRAKAVAA